MVHKNLIDLTNCKFGRWTVLERTDPPAESKAKRPATYWRCRCECGNEGIVSAGSLRSGSSLSCGCLKMDRLTIDRDLVGQRFGRWLVLSRADDVYKYGRRHKMWHCKCDCGVERDVTENSLVQGKSTSCGCYRKERAQASFKCEDLTGMQFGNWTVIRRAPNRNYPSGGIAQMWLCRCVCGTEHEVAGNMLKAGISQSCGCLRSHSIVEDLVRKCFDDLGIEYVGNKTYPDLKGPRGGNLSFDFLVLKNGKPVCLLECQGEQHYKPVAFFGGQTEFEEQMRRDLLKREYAMKLHIPLIEMPYTVRSDKSINAFVVNMYEQFLLETDEE